MVMKMKLVQLLAKELKEWPEGVDVYAQDADGNIFPWEGAPERDHEEWLCEGAKIHQGKSWFSSEKKKPCDDHMTANVTKSQWQAEREKMNEPKWIRHRGGKQPVEDSVKIEYRMRDGDISNRLERASDLRWAHLSLESDIMAYRIIEESKDQEIEEVIVTDVKLEMMQGDSWVTIGRVAPDFGAFVFDGGPLPNDEEVKDTNLGTLTYKIEVDTSSAMTAINELSAKWDHLESPLKWRDEIIELEAYEEEFRREREKLIRKLESEGFKLIDHVAPVCGDQIIDMSDWRNWQAGDIVECVTDGDNGQSTFGARYAVKSVNRSSVQIVEDDRGSNTNGWGASNFKFSSRP
jgi:hypothetical protein